jgi:hypothetical protein
VPITGPGLALRSGADSRGDLPLEPRGAGGAGGDGTSGNGTGGAGNGRGDGNRLIASWAPGMDFSQNYRVYPREARLAGIEGEVLLKCFALRRDRVRDCTLVAERPVGHGFGKAALKTERGLRIRVHNQAGRRVYDEWVVVRTVFDMPDKPVRAAADEAPADVTEAAP